MVYTFDKHSSWVVANTTAFIGFGFHIKSKEYPEMAQSILSTFSRLLGGRRSGMEQTTAAATSDVITAALADEPTKVGYLLAFRIFRDLSKNEMQMIIDSTVMKTAIKGQIIYMPGETGEILFMLKKGSVHLYRLSAEGRKLVIQVIEPMTFFGEMALIGQNMYTLFAEAAEDCTICVMGRADIERLMLMRPQVAFRMLEEIGQRMHNAQAKLSDSVFKGIPARVATLLLSLSQNDTQTIKEVTHQDIADMIGVYRETVSNALGRLRDEGIININRKEISVLDMQRLRELAEEETLRRH